MSKNDSASKGARVQPKLRNSSSTVRKNSLKGRELAKTAAPQAELSNQQIGETDPSSTFTVRALPSPPSSPAPQRKNSNPGSKRLSSSSLEALLHHKGYDKILNTYNLPTLWSASRKPPITKDTLSELDLHKLYDSLYLRHDLNFDRDIQFSPRSSYDIIGQRKRIEAQRYWDAIEIELELYGLYLEGLRLNLPPGSLLDAHCSLPTLRSLNQLPLRLEEMIRAICWIVKTLVPPTKWSSVEARLNPRLFIQELEHGQCDIENLFTWVGGLLLESCAPSRDVRINCMIKNISQGYKNRDSHTLRQGLQDLFCILEIMKLDTATYQVQLLRDVMLSRFIEDEQSQILWQIKKGWKVPNWLNKSIMAPETAFVTFTTRFITLITHPALNLPMALALDHTRIHKLQNIFQLLTFRAACSHTLTSTMHLLGWNGPAPECSKNSIASLISAIEQDLSVDLAEQREAIALGITSHAYKLCAKASVPSPGVLCHAERTLLTATEAGSFVANGIVASLSSQLTKLVEKELDFVEGMDAVQLSHRYTSKPTIKGLVTAPPAQQATLEDMARRIAHITILHWRVWAPILYLQPDN